ncbi:DUF4127 family protein [Actinopolymorpha alba]|uniref:DUF4127 family protein n=1 Tax=Actinopolymorpha alba TaxID=533267 RepID=UPI0003651538|nr:DUF4127 family protein [Actinopolymorpha alba]
MRIALLPLDERPVNATLPAQVAAIAGAELLTPPAELLPSMRVPGRADELAEWLDDVSGAADALVVSLDMLGYGGLIGSRTTHDPASTVIQRLSVLDRIRPRRPDLPISAVTTVMRASRSYSPAEEPEYWSSYGVELHELGAALHRQFLGEPHDRDTLAAVPADIQADFLFRRLRNHTVDLYTLGLAGRGTVDPLLVTADDTAPRAAGSLEQVWLRHWVSTTGLDGRVLMYPGADEVGSVLVARALGAGLDQPVRIAVRFCEETGPSRIAPYENVPISAGVARQIVAAGGVPTETLSDADAVLVVHAPDPERGDQAGRTGKAGSDQAAARAVADHVAHLVDDGHSVGVADVRYVNGADPVLVRELAERTVLDQIRAYGGWNTAGNTVGSVVAALVAHVVGRSRGVTDRTPESRLRWHRVVEDYAYQAVVRGELAKLAPYRDHMSVPFPDPATVEAYLTTCAERLAAVSSELGGSDARRWEITRLRLPWQRTFEIDFDLVPVPGS